MSRTSRGTAPTYPLARTRSSCVTARSSARPLASTGRKASLSGNADPDPAMGGDTMSVTAMVQDWMLGLSDREHAAVRSRAHISAETSQDLDAICSSIATDPFFVVPPRTAGGYVIDSSNVLATDDLVRDYYGGRMGGYLIVTSRQLKSFASFWYVSNAT